MLDKKIVIIRENEYLAAPEEALFKCMHTNKMSYANWAYALHYLCAFLGVDSGIDIKERLLFDFDPSDEAHRIIINGSRESNLTIEDWLHELDEPEVIEKCVNASGINVLKHALQRGQDPQELTDYLGRGYTIFPNNKVLTQLSLDPRWDETIRMLGYGHKIPGLRSGPLKSSDEKVVIKPVDRSHGDGVEFVSGDAIPLIPNTHALFGSYLVQEYVSPPSSLRNLHKEHSITDSDYLKLNTDMRVMLTALDKGNGVIGHIRVAINGNGKSNLSQDAEHPDQRAYAIGLNPNQPVTDPFDRAICKAYGVDPDKPRVPKHIARRCAELMDIHARPLLGFDFGLAQDSKHKLFEINITPGSAIYSYYGATNSKELQEFVKKYNLDQWVDQKSVDQLNFSPEEIAAHRVINVLCKARAFLRVRVDNAMNALGVDNSIYGGDYKW